MNTDDKFLVKKDKCESQNHLIRELSSFKDVNGKGDPFVLHVKKSDLDACKITDPWERRRQGRELMKVMTNLMDMDAEFFEHFGDELGIKRHSQPTRPFLPTTAYDNYSLYDIMAEMETLDPLGYDARGEQVPLKIRYITPQKAKKIKVDECGPGECTDEKEKNVSFDKEIKDLDLEKDLIEEPTKKEELVEDLVEEPIEKDESVQDIVEEPIEKEELVEDLIEEPTEKEELV